MAEDAAAVALDRRRGMPQDAAEVVEQAAVMGPEGAGELLGAAGSRGFARGTARVIKNIKEATRLEPGDILVAETTAAPWTPLFATAAALVTETGGILSHCAVVAREYGIPAVVGTGSATTIIRDGQLLEVDGGSGIVRILDGDDRQGSV